jgi:hypothetical protein
MKKSIFGLMISISTGCASVQSPSVVAPIATVVATAERCQVWHTGRAELQRLLHQSTQARDDAEENLADANTSFELADQLLHQRIKSNRPTVQESRDRETARVHIKRITLNLTTINTLTEEINAAINMGDYDCNN